MLLSSREPDKIVAARIGNAGGVVVGVGDGEMFIASDIPAILEHTRRMAFLESGQVAIVRRDGFDVTNLEGKPLEVEVHDVAWDAVAAEKGEYKHFMLKEIHEQVRSITDTIGGRVDFARGSDRPADAPPDAGSRPTHPAASSSRPAARRPTPGWSARS